MPILLIDTSSERGIIAYGTKENILFTEDLPYGNVQSTYLVPRLNHLVEMFSLPSSLDYIAVGIGPGSYTGIRLGVSVAETLSYSWKKPLVGICSLDGYVPEFPSVSFAGVIDARIGGVYLQTGGSDHKKKGEPELVTIEKAGLLLQSIPHIVTPAIKSLPSRFAVHFPAATWTWEERSPSVVALMETAERNYKLTDQKIPPFHLDLLYLQKTEAERVREKRDSQN